MRFKALTLGIAVAAGCATFGARAQSFADVLTQGRVDGEIRLYNFNRIYSSPAKPDASAFSGALLLNAQTATFGGGFSLGASLLTANAFGTQSDQISKIDTTLMGPNNSLTALGQAYVQYKSDQVLFKIGDQYLNTPWMGGSDSRVLPASYQALSAALTPIAGWKIFAIRSYGWKSRTSGDYHFDNLYYPAAYKGDQMYGGIGGLPLTARSARGTWALGTSYHTGGFKAQAWYYDFFGFAQMGYVDGSFTFKTDSGIDPYVGAQYMGETAGSSNSILVENGVKLFKVRGNKVKSQAFGAAAGIKIPHGQLDVSYDNIPTQAGAIGDGAVISPYTAAYATDPLYTTSMIRGLVEQGPGHAWKAKFLYGLLNGQLLLHVAYAKYTTALSGNSHDVYFDVTYKLDGWMEGLSIRDRLEWSTGGIGLNPGNASFIYNRLMIDYRF
ncbi:MAG TPA: hypothetical protein VF292_01010 [Rhodanobacteraceae bacterium]